jgi:hypothetical protein
MATKKKKKRTAVQKHKCGVCGKRGHNKRSHKRGGRLAKR